MLNISLSVSLPFEILLLITVLGLYPSFNWIIFLMSSFMSSLHVLEIRPPLIVGLVKIFSHSVDLYDKKHRWPPGPAYERRGHYRQAKEGKKAAVCRYTQSRVQTRPGGTAALTRCRKGAEPARQTAATQKGGRACVGSHVQGGQWAAGCRNLGQGTMPVVAAPGQTDKKETLGARPKKKTERLGCAVHKKPH